MINVVKLFVLITLPDLLTACYAGALIIISSEADKVQDFNLADDLVH